jgi:transcriptional regulator with XRE-family HTH domain
VARKLSKKAVREVRERFQRAKPTQEQLVESGEYGPFVPRAVYFAAKQVAADLKRAREAAGLSLSQVAAQSDVDKATLSRLESGKQLNPTLETLVRYAEAVDRRLCLTLAPRDDGGAPGGALPAVLAAVAEATTRALAAKGRRDQAANGPTAPGCQGSSR